MSLVNTSNIEEVFRTVHACSQCIGNAEPTDEPALPDDYGRLVRILSTSLQEAYEDCKVLVSHADIAALFEKMQDMSYSYITLPC